MATVSSCSLPVTPSDVEDRAQLSIQLRRVGRLAKARKQAAFDRLGGVELAHGRAVGGGDGAVLAHEQLVARHAGAGEQHDERHVGAGVGDHGRDEPAFAVTDEADRGHREMLLGAQKRHGRAGVGGEVG